MGTTDHLACLLRNLYAGQEATVRTRHGTMEWIQIGKGVWQGCILSAICNPAYLTDCRVQSVKCQSGWIISWNQDCLEKYQQPQICRWYNSNGRKWIGTKESLDEGERGEWKIWLKTQHSQNKDHGFWAYHSVANRWGKSGNNSWFYFLGL